MDIISTNKYTTYFIKKTSLNSKPINMKSAFLAICFTLYALSLSGQQSNIDLCTVYNHAVKTQSLDTLNHLLNQDTLQINNFEKNEMLTMRGWLRIALNKAEIDKNLAMEDPILQEAYRDFSMAVQSSEDKNDKLKYVSIRFLNLKSNKLNYKEYQSDLGLLTDHGYRQNKFGLGIAALSKYDREIWLGAELLLFSGYIPSYKIKDGNEKTLVRKRFSTSASALIFGVSKNLESAMSDVNFSLLRLESPLFVNVTQFGFIRTLASNHWYYRPEIGIGYSIFHLSVGYTMYFKNQKSESLPTTPISFRIKHTF